MKYHKKPFKTGDLVLCVDATKNKLLKKDLIYKVVKQHPGWLVEVEHPDGVVGAWFPERFVLFKEAGADA